MQRKPPRTLREQVQKLIKKLSAEDRKAIIPFLATLPDSGVKSYDLQQEIATLKKHGQTLPLPTDEAPTPLFQIRFVRDLVEIIIDNKVVLRTVFYSETFAQSFPNLKDELALHADAYLAIFTEEKKAERRADLKAQGIEQTEEEFETTIKENCEAAARYWVTEKANRISEAISRHLPGMVSDMMIAAIKGQTFYDLHEAYKQLKPDDEPPSVKGFKKMVLDAAWRDIKPHLPATKHVRTHPDWRGDDTRKQYSQRVNERKLLATCIKDMFEECEHGPGWMVDLKNDPTFQRLSLDVPKEVIEFAMKRVASDGASDRERQPLSVALEMARRELELQEQDIETLHKYYAEGSKLLKAERGQRQPSSI